MGGILVGLCVLILQGPNKGLEGPATDYNNGIYTIEYTFGDDKIRFRSKTKVHENYLRECKDETKSTH